jgi:plasmid maintenance system killer protein
MEREDDCKRQIKKKYVENMIQSTVAKNLEVKIHISTFLSVHLYVPPANHFKVKEEDRLEIYN